MPDNTALERHIGLVLDRMGGPEPMFDAMAIVRAAASQSPKWRFRAMFSATRFVVAATIVALFGGLVLSGVVTLRQSGQPAPGAASPSPTTTQELLSGMVTEEVEPGVFRILDDGAGHDLVKEPPLRVAVGPDDAVWLLGGSGEPALFDPQVEMSTLIQLGLEGTHPIEIPGSRAGGWDQVAVDDAGSVWLIREGFEGRYHDGMWVRDDPSVGAGVAFRRYVDPGAAAVPPDGITWPVDDVRVATPLVIGPTGTGWVYLDTSPDPAKRTDRAFMARLADGAWEVYEAPSGYTHYYTNTQLAVDAEGGAWIWFELRWPRELPAGLGEADVPPGILSFDGQAWRRHLEGILVHDVAFTSDGSAWVTSRYGCDRSNPFGKDPESRNLECAQADTSRAGLYVITPEAMEVVTVAE